MKISLFLSFDFLLARNLHVTSQRVGSLEFGVTSIADHGRWFSAFVLNVTPQMVGVLIRIVATLADKILSLCVTTFPEDIRWMVIESQCFFGIVFQWCDCGCFNDKDVGQYFWLDIVDRVDNIGWCWRCDSLVDGLIQKVFRWLWYGWLMNGICDVELEVTVVNIFNWKICKINNLYILWYMFNILFRYYSILYLSTNNTSKYHHTPCRQ